MKWYEELAEELLGVRQGGIRQLLIFCARDYAQGQALVLLELYCGDAEERSPSELAATLDLSSGRVANILKSLQGSGYVIRERDGDDARRVHVALTEAGASKAAELYNAQVNACGAMLRALGEEDARELVRIMSKIPELGL